MTTPVTTPAAPPARPAASSGSGSTDSAGPFASVLDGALCAGRAEVDGAGAQAGGDPAADQEEAGTPDSAEAPAEPAPVAPNGGVAALWARLKGAAGDDSGEAGATGVPPVGTPVAAGREKGEQGTTPPPGHAVALDRAGGLAIGLRRRIAAETPGTPPVPAPVEPVPAPGTVGPTTPVPDAAALAAEALAAAGVEQVVVAPPAPSTGDGEVAPALQPPAGTSPSPFVVGPLDGTVDDSGPLPAAGTGEDRSAGTDAVPAAGATTAPSPTAPVRAEAPSDAAAAPPVGGQIARSVAVLRGGPDGSHTMTVVLTPESLGPVEVSVTVSQGIVELTLRGAHEHGRAALLEAVPDLRRDLEAAGLTCTRLDVDRGNRDGGWSSSQQHAGRPGEQGPGNRSSQRDSSDDGARPWHRSADRGEGTRAPARAAAGLDLRV